MHHHFKNLSFWLNNLSEFLWPTSCIVCRDPADFELSICSSCIDELPWNFESCKQCATSLKELNSETAICGSCIANPPSFTQIIALFEYQDPAIKWITSLKFNQQLKYARILGKLLAIQIQKRQQPLPQLIIPMPLHKKRLRERGFNQALEIAKPIAKQLKINLDFESCQRVKPTVAQSSLPAKERYANVKSAFALTKPVQTRHVAIVDDVVTTASTVNELSKLLKKSGVEMIEVWCGARA